jgi:hypothetical protein
MKGKKPTVQDEKAKDQEEYKDNKNKKDKEKGKEKEPFEQQLVIDLEPDSLLKRLNYLVTKFQALRDHEALTGFEDRLSKLDTKQLERLIKFIKVDVAKSAKDKDQLAPTYTTDPGKLFREKATPWIGEKESLNIYNKNFVIGLKDSTDNIKYRIDYDDKKQLHVNLYIFGHSFSISLAPESKRFKATSSGENHKIDGIHEQCQMIKYKFWTKMTLAYHAHSPENAHPDETFLLCNVLGKSFEDVKDEMAKNLPDEQLSKQVYCCSSNKELSELICVHKQLRDNVLYHVVQKRTEGACFYSGDNDTHSETMSEASPAASPVKKAKLPKQPPSAATGSGVSFSKPKLPTHNPEDKAKLTI